MPDFQRIAGAFQQRLMNFFKPDILETLYAAGRDLRTVVIAYKDASGEVTSREGEPYEINEKGFYMFCYLRNEIRLFKPERIIGAEITEKTFIPKWPVKMDWWQ